MEPRRDDRVSRLLGPGERTLDKMAPRSSIFPTRPAGLPQTLRMSEMLDQVKAEYESLALDAARLKQVNDEYERKIEQQLGDLEAIQRTVYELQNNQSNIRHKYEEEINRLRGMIHSQDDAQGPSKRPKLDESKYSRGPDKQEAMLPSIPRSEPLSSLATTLPGARKPFPDLNVGDTLNRLSSNLPPQMENGKNTLAPLNIPNDRSGIDAPLPSFNRVTEKPLPPLDSSREPLTSAHHRESREALKNERPPSETGSGKGSEMDDDKDDKDKEDKPDKDWILSPPGNEIELSATHHHASVVCCVRFSGDGTKLATGSNKIAQVFDTKSNEIVATFSTNVSNPDDPQNAKDSYVRSVCFSPDSKFIVAGADDKTIRIWDVETKKPFRTLSGHESEIYSLDYSHDGRLVVSGGGDKKAKIWSVEFAKCEFELGSGESSHLDGVTSVCFSHDSQMVATGSLDRVIRLWSTRTGQLINQFRGHDEPVYSAVFSPDGTTLASGSLDKTLKLWDLKTSKCRATLQSHSDYVLSVAFSARGEWIVSGSKDRTVAFWDARSTSESIQPRLALQGHRNSVISVGVSPAGPLFATGSGDSRARIWSFANLASP